MGRLKPGWTAASASARLAGMSPGIMAATEITGYDSTTVQKYRQFKLAAYSASTGVSNLPRCLRFIAMAAARNHRDGAVDRVRKSGQPDARAGQHAGARNRGAARVGRGAHSRTAPVDGRKLPAGCNRRSGGDRARAIVEPGAGSFAFYRRERRRRSPPDLDWRVLLFAALVATL